MRLQKYLAYAGVGSRRKCEQFILQGRVQVNGDKVQILGASVQPGRDVVYFDGKELSFEEKVYFAFYKPSHVMCTMSDPEGRPTIMDYFKDIDVRLYHAGRLDYDTEGLLLVTNDGELAQAVTHPSKSVEKVYYAECRGKLSVEDMYALRSGVPIEGRVTASAKVKMIRSSDTRSCIVISIHEGRNRQIRKMLEYVGHDVLFLRREKFANLTLQNMQPGQSRALDPNELRELRRIAGLD